MDRFNEMSELPDMVETKASEATRRAAYKYGVFSLEVPASQPPSILTSPPLSHLTHLSHSSTLTNMKLATSLIGLAALCSTALASTTVKYHHVLQASFVGTNHLSYQIYAGDELACSNTVDTTEFGDSTFEDQCNDDWKSE